MNASQPTAQTRLPADVEQFMKEARSTDLGYVVMQVHVEFEDEMGKLVPVLQAIMRARDAIPSKFAGKDTSGSTS